MHLGLGMLDHHLQWVPDCISLIQHRVVHHSTRLHRSLSNRMVPIRWPMECKRPRRPIMDNRLRRPLSNNMAD